MSLLNIARRRLFNQRIDPAKYSQPGEAVSWLGALQALNYISARWAVSLHCEKATNA
jgi:hypothetical protein